LLLAEGVADELEGPELLARGGERKDQPLALAVRSAAGDDGAVGRDDPAATRSGRLDGGRRHDAQQLLRVVRRHERLAEAGERVTNTASFGLELGEPRLELLGHVVERSAEGRELVPSPHGDALAKAALGD